MTVVYFLLLLIIVIGMKVDREDQKIKIKKFVVVNYKLRNFLCLLE